MDVERARTFLLSLPHVVETMQWGDNLVFWAGDKALGGKMFTLINLDGSARGVVSYAAARERFGELIEMNGLFPAPYFARIGWVAAERWNVFRQREWEQELQAAYDRTYVKLTPKTRKLLALPVADQQKLIVEHRELLRNKD